MNHQTLRNHRGNALWRLMAFCLTAVLFPWMLSPAAADTRTATVGNVTGLTTFVPVCMSWQDTWSETVYTADQLSAIPAGSTIKTWAYLGVSQIEETGIDYAVYVRETSLTKAPAEKSDLSEFTCVYDGKTALHMTSQSTPAPVLAVELQNAYVYQGGNLHVIVKAHTPNTGQASFGYQNVQGSTLLRISNDNWTTERKYSYNYQPALNLGVEYPEGYVPLQTATVGTDDDYDQLTPVSFNDMNSMSMSLYTSELLGIPANMNIHQISYRGCVFTTSPDSHRVRVWMANTNAQEVGTQAPALEAMTLVADKEILLDTKQGSMYSWKEIMKIELDKPFLYTGGNLLVVVQAGNTSSQYVYFCANNYYGLCAYGTGGSDNLSDFSIYPGQLPTTNFYYAEPAGEIAPEVSLVTKRSFGQKLGVFLSSRDGVRIDWGGGQVMEYPYGGFLTINHDLYGSEVKVYPLTEGDHIETFACSNGDVTSIEFNAPGLKKLELRNNHLDGFTFDGCPALEYLDLSGNNIFEFSASSTTLRTLKLSHCSMEQLIINECTALEYLDVSINSLRYPIWLFWPESPNLRYLDISFNQILGFDLSPYTFLETLICNHNNISELDLSCVPRLQTLRAGYTAITSLDVAKCPNLKVLDLAGAQTGEVRVKALPALTELNMELTGISKIDLSANTRLRKLVLSRNSLTEVDLKANPEIEHLDVSHNSLSQLSLSNLKGLSFLDCSSNGLSALDLTANAQLDTVSCAFNKLSKLPLPALNHISRLDISSNSFSALPAPLTQLNWLNAADNMLESIDVSQSTMLLGLDVRSNKLGKDALNALFRQLPDINGIEIPEEDKSWMSILNYNDNPGTAEVSSEIPETKGWNCSYRPDILGDASAAIQISPDKVYSRMSFAIDTPDPVYYVDWGDGRKVEFRTENPQYTSNSIVGYAAGEVIRIYAPSTTELGICNAQYLATDVSGMPELQRLSCSGNNFSTLDLTANSKLTELNCRENPLTSVALPENSILESLDCSSTLMRSIDLSLTPRLKYLAINSCRLESLDLSALTELTELRADGNNLRSLDLSAQPNLVSAYLSDNQLEKLDVSKNVNLVTLTVDYNKLSSLDLSPLKSLETAHVNHNSMSSLTVDNPLMKILFASDNELESIDLSHAEGLKVLTVNNNRLSKLDVSASSMIEQVFAGYNRLTDITFAPSMWALNLLNVTNNRLTSVNLQPLMALSEFVATDNNLTGTLDFSSNPALKYVNVGHNSIEAFKWGSTSNVATIYASYNKLTTLNVPSAELTVLDCSRNELEAVNLSKNTSLFYLMLDFNRLTSVSVVANSGLWGVSLRANLLDAASINRFCNQLPDITELAVIPGEEAWMKYLFLSGNPGVADADVAPAVNKGWMVVTNEEIPVDRKLTVKVVDAEGAPVAGAKLVLIVDGEDVSFPAEEQGDGVYVYDPLPVFMSLSYDVRVEKAGYVSKTVDVTDVREGDMSLTVALERDLTAVDDASADEPAVAGGIGCLKVWLPADRHVTVHDISGRVVFDGCMVAGENTVDSLAPGIYIALGKKVAVR